MKYVIRDTRDNTFLIKAQEKRARKNQKRLEIREKENNAKIHISESKDKKGT